MKPRRFFFILSGLLAFMLVAGGGGYYFASMNLEKGIGDLSKRLGDKQLSEQKLADLDDLQKQHERLKPMMPIIYNALPTEKEQSKIAIQLRNIARASNMELDGLNFAASSAPGPTSQTVPVGDVFAVPITFTLYGSYSQLQAFLQRQEKLDRYTTVTGLDISESESSLSFNITLNTFVKP